MTDPDCPACGATNPSSSPTRKVVGVRGPDDPPLYACSPVCASNAFAAALRSLTCQECRDPFDPPGRRALGRRGSPSDYCSRACQLAAGRRREEVFQNAARPSVPVSYAEIVTALGNLEHVLTEVAERRTTVPSSASGRLSGYRDLLVTAKADAERRGAEA